MARPSTPTLTENERKVLEVLWKKKSASVREVTDELSKKSPTAYTTVLTMLGILEKKGLVSHVRDGRAFIYSAAISRSEATASALQHLLKQFFNGSPAVLAQHLVQEHDIGPSEMDALRRMIDDAPDDEKK
jgi:predicted transcriptional regulator